MEAHFVLISGHQVCYLEYPVEVVSGTIPRAEFPNFCKREGNFCKHEAVQLQHFGAAGRVGDCV
jgi:hypothetical protein